MKFRNKSKNINKREKPYKSKRKEDNNKKLRRD